VEISYQKVCRQMDALGYAESTIGTRMIRDAVQIVADDARVMFCKDVYPAIAKKYGCKPADVERAMRTATAKAKRSPNWEWSWRNLGGVNTPTNGEVVWRLVRECSIEWEELEFGED